jgi:hypothetical protein
VSLYLRTKKGQTAIFGTVDGPGARLGDGETILASKVNPEYVAAVRDSGFRSESVELVELDDDGHEQTGAEVNKEVDEPGEDNSGLYNPADHKVDEVLEYLSTASPDEVQRVKNAELETKSSGRPSARIAKFGSDE